jgi:hypothetical protein
LVGGGIVLAGDVGDVGLRAMSAMSGGAQRHSIIPLDIVRRPVIH